MALSILEVIKTVLEMAVAQGLPENLFKFSHGYDLLAMALTAVKAQIF